MDPREEKMCTHIRPARPHKARTQIIQVNRMSRSGGENTEIRLLRNFRQGKKSGEMKSPGKDNQTDRNAKKNSKKRQPAKPGALGILKDLRENARTSGRFRFFQKMAYMLFNRMFANAQMSGDFFIRPALTDVFHNLHFTMR
jgi:hypothetical protein